jgi:DNA-binding NarL/FixJ family response regulator
VLQLAVSGVPDKQIAARLGISTATVRSHVRRLCEKLGAANRCQLAGIATAEGLVEGVSADALVQA